MNIQTCFHTTEVGVEMQVFLAQVNQLITDYSAMHFAIGAGHASDLNTSR